MTAAMLATPSYAQNRQDAASVSQPASSTEGAALEEIVVTAERRVGDLQRTAAAVSVRKGDLLVSQGRTQLEQILEGVPGVSTNSASQAAASGTDTPSTQVNIRGMATNNTSNGGGVAAVPATAVYVDDIYSGIGGNYDLEQVEVLRGPQGTLYGRSATAGVVATHTRGVNLDKFSADGSAEIGNRDLRRYTLALGGPIVEDKVGIRAAFNQYQRSGYYVDTGGSINTTEGRIKLLIKPTDGFSMEIGAAIQDNHVQTGGLKTVLTDPDHFTIVSNDTVGSGKNRFEQYWVRANADLGFGQLAYIGALRTWEQDALNIQIGPGGIFLDQKVVVPKDNFLTQELRLSSQQSSPVKWQVGVFYYDNNLIASNDIRFTGSGILLETSTTHRQTNDIGVFAEGTVPLADSLRFTGGIRYDRTVVLSAQEGTLGAAASGLPFDLPYSLSGDAGRSTFNNMTYKARLEYDITPRNLLYASVSSGFVPGDVQVSQGTPNRYSAETLTAYEIGSKNRFLNNRLQLNASAFYYNYGGYQTQIYKDPSNPSSAKVFNLPLNIWGGEFEAVFAVTKSDRIGLNGLITDSKIHDAPSDFGDYSVLTSMWGSPTKTLNGFYSHMFDFENGSNVNLYLEANYRGRYNIETYSPEQEAAGVAPYKSQRPIVLANANLTWTAPNNAFSLTGYVRNIFDVVYKENAIPSLSGTTLIEVTSTISAPRTYGLIATAHF